MAQLTMNAEELISYDGFYYDHRVKLVIEGVNEKNYKKAYAKLLDIAGDEIYDDCGKSLGEYRPGCDTLTVFPLDLIHKRRYSFNDLMRIMYILTAENGCEWDKAQTMKSICPNMIEEAYELVTAIYNNDVENIVEEAGDVILQGVFHCVLGEKEGLFDATDVISGLCRKLITRHTHIFGNVKANNAEEALAAWESAKNKEKNYKTPSSKMDSIPSHLPADERAAKALKYAAKVGVGENDKARAASKIREDIEKVEKGGSCEDLIWDCIVLLRLNKEDAEVLLNNKLNDFISRFKRAEEEGGGDITSLSKEEMEKIFKEKK